MRTMTGGQFREFSTIGAASKGRLFPGFQIDRRREDSRLSARQAVRLDVRPEDLVSLMPVSSGTSVDLIAFDPVGEDALLALGLAPNAILNRSDFDGAEFNGWAASMGGGMAAFPAARVPVSEMVGFRASAPVTLWAVLPVSSERLVQGFVPPEVRVSVKRGAEHLSDLPRPIGHVQDEFTVRRGTARAYSLKKGEFVQIIDVEGQQCSDFMAFRRDGLDAGLTTMIDSTATRSMVRQAYPRPGLLDKFFDSQMRPLLRVVQDTCGRHDTLGLACTARGYEERGFPGHLNCSDNISAAMAPFDVPARAAWPAINFFWNTWVEPGSGHILTEESHSRPGDYVVMEALEDLICVSTACPDDIDPINGWNPTDVHVRVYASETKVQKAIAYRETEDAPMSISRETAFHARTSALTPHFAPARDLWTPVSFPSVGTIGEYWACRERATLQDMSSLRKYDVIGPDAETLLQRALTKDVAKLALWRGAYALMCDDTGTVVDDGTLFRLAPELFRWCCGTEESARRLEQIAREEGLSVRVQNMSDALVNLALQGPKSRDILHEVAFVQPHVPSLDQMKWFGVTIARLADRDGAPFMLSRTGYTGELGYEIFCAPAHAIEIWDALMAAGQAYGIAPMGNAALEVLRIEAGFAASGAEFAPGHDAFEAGLGFAVNLKKVDFVGRAALTRNAESPRKALKGLLFACNDVPAHGAPVFTGERQIGTITSATRSPTLEHAIAMARVAIEFSENATELEVGMMDGRMKRLPAVVSDIPFVDPQRERARA